MQLEIYLLSVLSIELGYDILERTANPFVS